MHLRCLSYLGIKFVSAIGDIHFYVNHDEDVDFTVDYGHFPKILMSSISITILLFVWTCVF